MSEGMLSVSNAGVVLIQEWDASVRKVARLRAELNSAECQLDNAKNALGKWMVPKPKPNESLPIGEQFNICIENGFLSVTQITDHDYKVYWKKRPDNEHTMLR